MGLPDGWTEGTVRVDGVELQYYRTGEGPPVVVAHGFTDSGRYWIPLGEDLASAEPLGGRLVHVHGAGHTVFRDRYDAALAELRAFLRRVRPARPIRSFVVR